MHKIKLLCVYPWSNKPLIPQVGKWAAWGGDLNLVIIIYSTFALCGTYLSKKICLTEHGWCTSNSVHMTCPLWPFLKHCCQEFRSRQLFPRRPSGETSNMFWWPSITHSTTRKKAMPHSNRRPSHLVIHSQEVKVNRLRTVPRSASPTRRKS